MNFSGLTRYLLAHLHLRRSTATKYNAGCMMMRTDHLSVGIITLSYA